MKSPLVYLTAVKLKNQLKEAVKHPAKLIYIIVLAAVLWVLTNKVKQTKKLHPIIFIGASAVVGIVLGM